MEHKRINDRQMIPTGTMAEMRRSYLLVRAKNWGKTLAVAVVSLASLSISIAATLGLALNTIGFGREVRDACADCAVWLSDPDAIYWIVPLILVTGAITIAGAMWTNSQVSEIEEQPYVPTVSEQIAVLPQSDILVRGSKHPDALPTELLRAIPRRLDTDPNELLRPPGPAIVHAKELEGEMELYSSFVKSTTGLRAEGFDEPDLLADKEVFGGTK